MQENCGRGVSIGGGKRRIFGVKIVNGGCWRARALRAYNTPNDHPTMRVSLILALFVSGVFAADRGDRIAGFAAMKDGDKIETTYWSTGCFHDRTYELTFAKASNITTVAITQVARDNIFSGGTNRAALGMVTLSKADIKGLDKLLTLYRKPQQGGCTTTDTITFTHERGGKTISKEKIEDGACVARIFNTKKGKKEVVDLLDLISKTRFEMKNAATTSSK